MKLNQKIAVARVVANILDVQRRTGTQDLYVIDDLGIDAEEMDALRALLESLQPELDKTSQPWTIDA